MMTIVETKAEEAKRTTGQRTILMDSEPGNPKRAKQSKQISLHQYLKGKKPLQWAILSQ
jgi:hypothetical protein